MEHQQGHFELLHAAQHTVTRTHELNTTAYACVVVVGAVWGVWVGVGAWGQMQGGQAKVKQGREVSQASVGCC